jgi:hypothetical protein
MRDTWYGDNRDIVKWASVSHLCHDKGIKRVLYVVMYRPSAPVPHLNVNGAPVALDQKVQSHFRDVERISELGHSLNLQITVHKEAFQWSSQHVSKAAARNAYFGTVVEKISESSAKRLLVLLDPDTGLEPENLEWEHVANAEVAAVYGAMKRGDLLAIYQHQRRIQNWVGVTRGQFAQAVQCSDSDITTISSPVAPDVVFFAVSKA